MLVTNVCLFHEFSAVIKEMSKKKVFFCFFFVLFFYEEPRTILKSIFEPAHEKRASVAQLDALSDWKPGDRGFNPRGHVGKSSSAYGWSGDFSPGSLVNDRLDISEIFLKGP